MKYTYLLLIIAGLVTGLVACNKGSNKSPVAGKWQETKLRLYATDSTGAFLYDTTYLQPFTGSDYIQFNNNGTCVISNDYYYYPNEAGEHVAPQKISPTSSTMNYTVVGSTYVLSQQSHLVNPGGFDVRDTISVINTNTLFLHSILYSHVPGVKAISDSYYTR
jgi:hypothetical protein